MKEICLTQGLITLVDDEDYEYLSQWKWYPKKRGNTCYAWASMDRKTILMHRFILDTPKGIFTDHIDFNGLNNQRNNLRFCTAIQNNAHREKWGTKSKYKGVNPFGKRYRAQICIKGKPTHLGYFNTEEEAALKYNEFAVIVQGEFAVLNVV